MRSRWTAAPPVLRLWVLVLLLLGLMVVYVAGVSAYLALRVIPATAELRKAVPVEAEGEGPERWMRHEQVIEARIAAAQQWLVGWAVLGALLLPLAYLLLRKRLARPLADLEAALGAVARGDLAVRLPAGHHDEMGQLAAHFNEMTRVLRARAEEQGRFAAAGELLAGVAHEVNNPLMAIAGVAELRRQHDELPADVRGDFDQIVRQARRAGRLLSGLLRFVRAGGTEPERVDLNAVLQSAADLVSFQFPVNEIVLDTQLDPALPPVVGNAARVEQVFVNLLANAVDALRLVPPPRRIVVKSGARHGWVYLAVSDTGPGIPPEIAQRLFLPFVSTKGPRGTGLGLYISRQILREMGGELLLAPSDQGTRFVVRLPAASEESRVLEVSAAAPDGQTESAGSLAGTTVLVVDDEPAVRRPIARYLTKLGAQVVEAGDGLEALDAIAAAPVNVILADLRMPRLDGLGLYQRLQADRPELARRLVLLSGDLSQLEREGAVPVAPDRVLVKPVELPAIRQKLMEVMRAAETAAPRG